MMMSASTAKAVIAAGKFANELAPVCTHSGAIVLKLFIDRSLR